MTSHVNSRYPCHNVMKITLLKKRRGKSDKFPIESHPTKYLTGTLQIVKIIKKKKRKSEKLSEEEPKT